jgi:hypothetical protein
MGKHWKGPRKGGHGGGAGGHDFSSCRGHGVVIGTCDAARERETSKELVNLLNQAIEEVYPNDANGPSREDDDNEDEEDADKEVEDAKSSGEGKGTVSIENLLKAELATVKQRKHGASQNAVSINTDVKGITLIKLTRRRFCPIKLVNAIFERIRRENAPCSRHVIRMIPLKYVFFPNDEELKENLNAAIKEGLVEMGLIPPDDDEQATKRTRRAPVVPSSSSATSIVNAEVENKDVGDDTAVISSADVDANAALALELSTPLAATHVVNPNRFPYLVAFKSRNHNVLTKDATVALATEILRPYGYGDFRSPDVSQTISE